MTVFSPLTTAHPGSVGAMKTRTSTTKYRCHVSPSREVPTAHPGDGKWHVDSQSFVGTMGACTVFSAYSQSPEQVFTLALSGKRQSWSLVLSPGPGPPTCHGGSSSLLFRRDSGSQRVALTRKQTDTQTHEVLPFCLPDDHTRAISPYSSPRVLSIRDECWPRSLCF